MSQTSLKVLIIEDVVDLAEIIAAVVERLALKAITVTHGAQAITAIQEEDPDLILLDLALPDMRGWRILDAVKEATGQFSTPVVVITASSDAARGIPAFSLAARSSGL